MLVELAVQSEYGTTIDQTDLEQQKHEVIAKCRCRIEAGKAVYLNGDMSREEYAKIKDQNEREIVHWQTRTTDTQMAAVELKMCMNIVNQVIDLWEMSRDQDRHQVAHMLFEYIVYDLDTRRIVDFRLKSWADRYLILRTQMYGDGTFQRIQGKKMKIARPSRVRAICAPYGLLHPIIPSPIGQSYIRASHYCTAVLECTACFRATKP